MQCRSSQENEKFAILYKELGKAQKEQELLLLKLYKINFKFKEEKS